MHQCDAEFGRSCHRLSGNGPRASTARDDSHGLTETCRSTFSQQNSKQQASQSRYRLSHSVILILTDPLYRTQSFTFHNYDYDHP
jgi:hypothetical protein